MPLTLEEKQKMLRATAVIIPALMVYAIWMDGFFSVLAATAFAWGLNYLTLRRFQVPNRRLYTALLMLALTVCYALYDVLLSMPTGPHNLWFYIKQIVLHTSAFTLMSFLLAIPAWLLFWGIDHYLCEYLKGKGYLPE